MQLGTKSIIVAAAMAALPLSARAVTITYTIDPTLLYSPTRTGSYTAVPSSDITGTGAAETITLPAADAGYYFQFGVDGQISNLGGGSAASLPPGQSATGLAGFSFGVGDSNSAVGSIFATKSSNASGTALSTPVLAPVFSGAGALGIADGAGGIKVSAGIAGNQNVGSPSALAANYNLAVSAPTKFVSSIEIGTVATGSTTFTVLPYNAGTSYLAFTAGTAPGSSSAKYQQDGFTSADTAAPGPTLKLVIGSAVSTGPTHQPIISLVGSPTALTTYGSQDGTLTLTGKGSGSYNVAVATPFTTATTGYVVVTGFNPSTDTEIYALKLDSNGVELTAAQIQTVIGDINGTNGTNASTGVVASAITGIYTNLFSYAAGYDVLLTATGLTQPAELGFDFSSAGEQDSTVPNITVLGVAAVPEPATAAGVVLGAAGLLLGRRKNKAVIA